MGCGHRPASGLRWAFDEVEEAIILEDDCVPHPTFFPFCEELLERYRDDERVMHISGNQFVARPKPPIFSYSVSRYCLSWGWATWRRAFRHYDPEIRLWPALSGTSWLPDVLGDERAAAHWKRVFDRAHVERDRAGYWDFQWIFACWAQQGVSLLPEANLISNIGFGEDATHTKRANDKRAHLPSVPMTFPLRHPPFLVRDPDQDRMIFEKVVISQSKRSLFGRVRRRCASALPEPLRRAISLMKSKFFQTHGQPS
jgi:hypothetical protein